MVFHFHTPSRLSMNLFNILTLCMLFTRESGGQIVTNQTITTSPPFPMIDQIITPSDQCKEIVGRFASAISNFTLCSVTNARPIHVCVWCIGQYLMVIRTHHDFFVTIDEKGNPCREYFTNLDRSEIVTEAYLYVMNLWKKGNCDNCFQKNENGTIIPRINEDLDKFNMFYQITTSCFNKQIQTQSNSTCIECKDDYANLTNLYIDIGVKFGDGVCLDIVDTMNTTRELWSQLFNCVPERSVEVYLHLGMAIVGVIPFIFYFLAYALSTKQESRVVHQNRLAEVFAVTSNSGATDTTGFSPSRFGRSGSASIRSRSSNVPQVPKTFPASSTINDD